MTPRNVSSLVLVAALAALSTACKDRELPMAVNNPISPSTPVAPGDAVSVFGTVDNLSGQCPSLTMTINGIVVKTNQATNYGGSSGCAGVKSGDGGGVTGSRQSDGTVVAAFVSLTSPSPLPLSFTGTIAKLSGSCPDLVMTIGLFEVQTRDITGFAVKSCGDLKVGDRVTVTGTRLNGGPVIANGVDAGAAPAPTTGNVIGTVDKLDGVCPNLTLTIAATEVRTSAATTFSVSGGCGAIKKGDQGLVTGVRQADGSVIATFVSLTTPK
jgi:uncharacterized protein DUF5666